ncbi:MAG: septal ring lytic transglycosylase RlpA family protein [Deltaproteobacteria bacterium]|nr:septal ring lytic transglycosylase RlpA family protein [Deltaproteobacteria bacterium]
MATWRALLPLLATAALGALATGCSHARPSSSPGSEEEGEASFYSRSVEGRPTASGTIYQAERMTCAHRTHPFGTWLRVTRLDDERRSVEVVVEDRGPFVSGRIVDLSWAAARKLGMLGDGVIPVRVRVRGRSATGAR